MQVHKSGRFVASTLIGLAAMWALSASAGPTTQNVDFSLKTGQSVVGLGAVHPQLEIHDSGGNDVLGLAEFVNPVAYGGNKNGVLNVANGGLGFGFADVGGLPDYGINTKN